MDFIFDNNELFEELDFDQLREVWEIIDQKIKYDCERIFNNIEIPINTKKIKVKFNPLVVQYYFL